MDQISMKVQHSDNVQLGYKVFIENLNKLRSSGVGLSFFCDNALNVSVFEHAADFGQLQGTNLKINKSLLESLGEAYQNSENDEEKSRTAKEYTVAVLGLIGYFQEVSKFWQGVGEAVSYTTWFVTIGYGTVTSPLNIVNGNAAKRMAKNSPELAFGLGVYRVLTFSKIQDDHKKDYKQQSHATPFQIAKYLNDESHIELAAALLELAAENNYVLIDSNSQPEITLEEINKVHP